MILLYHRKGVLSTPFRLFLRLFFQNCADLVENGANTGKGQQNQNQRKVDTEEHPDLVPDLNDGEEQTDAEKQQADEAGDDILDSGLHN